MFPQRLRELRKSKKLTMKEFGKKFNLAESTISGYEKGIRKPDLDLIEQFANFFGVSTDYLLGRIDNPESLPTNVIENNHVSESTINNHEDDDDSRPATKEDIERLLSHNPELKEMALLFYESPPAIKQAVKSILKEFKEKEQQEEK